MWHASELVGYGLMASDGSIGTVSDWLFDDQEWVVRWAVIDTGTWLPGRKVLLPPSRFDRPDAIAHAIAVPLSREQIENSPPIDEHEPVSRQMELNLYSHYGVTPYIYPVYFAPPAPVVPPLAPPVDERAQPERVDQKAGDPHLRSINEVTGYYVEARDGDIGHVEEFLLDENDWSIRYLVIDTRNWWPGRGVLLSPRSIRGVSWSDEQIEVELTRAQVETSPPYDPAAPIDRDYEAMLHGHYGLRPYWG